MTGLLKKLVLLFVFTMTIISGCENLNKESGTFSVKFTWPENNKPDFSTDSYYAWIDIREWIDGDAENMKIHLKEGPVAFDNEGKLTLKLENLSYGKNRVIVVEVRKSNSDQDRTLYYGISQIFDLSIGKHTDVTVDMNFTPGTAEGTNSFAIDIFQNDVKITSTANEKVSIRVLKATGSKVVFSNRLDLLDIQINNETRDYTGSEVIDFSTLTKIDDITFEYPEWDITEGREDAENGDGNKTVYAKVIDSNGYRSEMAYATVNLDTTTPSVSNITISPAGEPGLANIGTQIVVKFIMSEPVSEFTLFSEGIEMTDKSSGSDMYFTYTVTDNDVDGSIYNFKVSAKDNAGNELKEFPLGSVQIDSTLPQLIDFAVSKTKVRTKEEFSIELEVSEKLTALNVLVGAKSISEKCDLEDGSETKYICKHLADIDGDEGDGVKQIAVELTDLAGNKMSQTLKKDTEPVTIEYDITPPILASSVILPETVNKSSDKINLKFSFAEKVNFDLSDLVLDPDTDLVFDCGNISTASKSFECSAPFAIEDQRVADYNVSVSVSDEVGNESKNVELGTISVDRISPSLSSQDLTPEAVKLNEEFTITFGISEPLLADPLVRIGDKTLPSNSCSFSSVTSLWTCTHLANKDGDEPDGQKMVSVYLVDKAGNASTEIMTKSINYDATPPTILNSVFLPGPKVNSNDDLFWVRFSFSEKVKLDGSLKLSFTKESGDDLVKTFSCTHTDGVGQSFSCVTSFNPEDVISGTYIFFVDAEDLSGNKLLQDGITNRIGKMDVDRKLPQITIGGITPAKVNYQTDYIEVIFSVNKPVPLSSNPVVKIGTSLESAAPYSVNTERTEFTYRISNLQMAGDGNYAVNIKVEDTFENSGEISQGGIEFDRTRPVVISSNLNSVLAKSGDEIVVSITFSEEMKSASVKIDDSGLGMVKDTNNSTDRIFIYRYPVTSSDAGARETDYAISILGDDTFDNRTASPHQIGSVTLDLTPPSDAKVVNLEITTATSHFYLVDSWPVASSYQPEIDFSFSVTNADQISERPVVYFGGLEAVIYDCTGTITDIVCTGSYHITGNEGEGIKHMTVDLYDDAGNIYSVTPGWVLFDFTGPRLVSTSVTRDPAFAHSRDETEKIQYFSRKDPFSEIPVQLILTMYADELIDTAFSNSVENLPCESGSYPVKTTEINGNSFTHARNVNDCLGLYSPMVIWRDFVGNETARESAWKIAVVDDQPDPLNIKRDYITYYRKPFGSIDSTPTPEFYLTASPGTIVSDDIAMVAIYTETGVLAGTAVVENDGSFNIETLTGGDVPVIYINPVSFTGNKIPVKDDLGNTYDIKTILQPVPNVVWTANLNRKVAGVSWPNPTTFRNYTKEVRYLQREAMPESTEVDTFPAQVNGGISASRRDGDYLAVYGDSMGSFFREGKASAFNPVKGTLLVFGGKTVSDGGSLEYWYNDLAEWNGSKWEMIEVEGAVPDRSQLASMVYFESEDMYVLFGGSRHIDYVENFFSETWTWNGISWIKSSYGPAARANAAFAYDPVRKKAVMFGGYGSAGTLYTGDPLKYVNAETWEFDGSEWTLIVTEDPEGDGDPLPGMGEMVYDQDLRKSVYYDGVNGKTWAYDGTSWDLIGSGGPLLKFFSMVYDSTWNRIVLLGGMDNSYIYSKNLYTFTSGTWTATSSSPYKINNHIMWHSKSDNTVYAAFGAYEDLWIDAFRNYFIINGNVWKEGSFQTHMVQDPAMAYYPSKNKLYQFGGTQESFADTYTFVFDGYKWSSIDNGSTRPAVEEAHDMIYYPPADVLLLFDRTDNKMWQFDGTTWSVRTASGGPSKVDSYRMEYYPDLGHVVFIGQIDGSYKETWTYNGSTWTKKCSNGTPGECVQPDYSMNFGFAVTYHPENNYVYAFAHNSAVNGIKTWRWNGTIWSEITITDPEGDGKPGYLTSPVSVYSSTMQRIILMGATQFDSFDIWSFNGSSFKKIAQTGISRRTLFDAVWMDNIESIVIRGGRDGYYSSDFPVKDFFVVKMPGWVTPTQSYTVPLNTAGIPDNAALQKIDITWIGGGTSMSSTGLYDGTIMSVWNQGGWEEFTYGKGSSTNNSRMFEEITDASMINSMISGFEQSIAFKLNPKIAGSYSSLDPVVSTSAVEVNVYYNVEGKTEIAPYLDKEYLIASKGLNYESARQTCLEWGGDLVIMNNADEAALIKEQPGFDINTKYWIGVNDIHEDTQFRAVSGRLIWSAATPGLESYVSWAKANPYSSSTDNCVYTLNDKWTLSDCSLGNQFICERSRENKYVISTKTALWDDAKTECELLDMNLMIIDGPNEQLKISELAGKYNFWIGYTDKDIEGTWQWINGLTGWIGISSGTSYYYNNWGIGFPSNDTSSYDYAFVAGAGSYKWRNNSITAKYFICEEVSDENFCSLNSQDCTLSDECCSGICSDNYGECVACLKNGDSDCVAGSNCCDGICNTSSKECVECLNLNESTCTNITDCCDKSATCASGKCCYGLATECTLGAQCCAGMTCGESLQCCKTYSTSCKENDECCSGLCTGTTRKSCSCSTTGGGCTVNSNCCSGICFKGICQCSELGDQCIESSDCCSGNCYKGTCVK